MNQMRLHTVLKNVAMLGVLVPTLCVADTLETTVKTQKLVNAESNKSQQRIDKLADKTSELVFEYKSVIRQTEGLKAYNDQNEKIVRAQRGEIDSLDKQISELEQTRTEVVPLMLRMIDSLEKFVAADLPFQLSERRDRIASLKEVMDRADVSTSEKYRKILEAYQVENEYGRNIEAYKASLVEGIDTKTYEFLRIGRVALVYQSPDGAETGHWNKETKEWERLPESYRSPVSQGLRIAKKQAPPALIKLPVLAAREK